VHASPLVEERLLLARLREGDQDAFDAIFRAHYPQLVGIAERMLGQRGVAEELAQDVMLELWRRRESLSVDETLRGYLCRAVRNRALNEVRHERVARAGEPYAMGERATAPVAHAELVEQEIDAALQAGVADLPPRCREVFELSRVHGLRYAEIADALGISVKTVEAQMGKALKHLRVRLAAWLPEAPI
jgi:RNA polymerase sigma-70 factor, ECF subfamily